MLSIADFLKLSSETNSIKIFLLVSLGFCLLAETNLKASAQVVPDTTLPNNSLVTPDGDIINITEGTTVDNNLFHSFEQFSLLTGKTAFFQNDLTIENIISRVTGNSISNIDGLIRSLGDANLFLINPNGIIFGKNASLDIGGSFIGSTADSIKFADGSEFSAINPQEPPLLTVNIPVGLQYGLNPGNIVVEGAGNNLVLNQDFSIDRTNRPDGLKVSDGNTFALVGQDLNISGGNITAAEGNIELWAVNNGLVSISDRNGQLQIETGQEPLTYGNIELSQAASVDASGNSGGRIQLQGQNITVQDGSVILTDTLGTGSGGNLEVRATESVEVTGISALSPIFSSILADVAPGATGNGGNIVIETDSLQVTEGGQISSGTFGVGNAGTLTVTTQNLQVSGGSPFGPSGLFTPVALGATGNGGDLSIETGRLEITDAGQISSGTFGFGDGGDLTIKADEIYVSGGNEFAPSTIDTTVFKIPGIPEDIATFLGAGVGNGGNLVIETGTLQVTDGAQIAVSTSGSGKAGNLEIQAENVELSGFSEGGRSGLFANTIIESGNGGNINLNSDRLLITDGATISVGNFASNPNIPPGTGTAGNITIDSDSIELDSSSSEIFSSVTASTNAQSGGKITLNVGSGISLSNGSQITSETRGEGDGGKIELTADTLELNSGGLFSTNTAKSGNAGSINLQIDTANFNGAGSGVFSEVQETATGDGGNIVISADEFNLNDRAQVSVNSTGLGQAGNIAITSDDLNLDRGKITATSTQTGGGNIAIDSDFLFLDNQSLISTSVLDSTGGGGNLTINSDYLIAQNNSDLRANAVLGTGGNIQINTEVIFTSFDSDIDASSQFGLDGVVEINSPEFDKQIGVVLLSTEISDPTQLIVASCPVQKENIMVVTGKGGLPANPHPTLRGQSVWQDLRDLSIANSDPTFLSQNRSEITPETKDMIVEAQGWAINNQGVVELITHAPQPISEDFWHPLTKCSNL
jgi:filamentous hemagglutinin family protein